jgi:prophage tail gpP-like protein
VSFDLSADSDFVTLRILDTGEEVPVWSSYTVDSEFLTPSDGFTFVCADEDAVYDLAPKLLPGTFVQLEVNDAVVATGIVDGQNIAHTPGSGTVLTVECRDAMGRLVDACVDPLFVFSAGMTLADLFTRIVAPLGFTTFSNSDKFRQAIVAKTAPPAGTTSPATPAPGAPASTLLVEVSASAPPLTSFTLQQAKPHEGEGAFAFLARHCKRFGLWLWSDSLGSTIIVGSPDYTSAPLYSITNRVGDGAFYDSIKVDRSTKEQPSLIIATGHGAGGDFDHAPLKSAAVNELVALDDDDAIVSDVQSILAKHKGCTLAPLTPELRRYGTGANWSRKKHWALFLHDQEAKTPAQLENFVQREMGERQSHAYVLRVTVGGHTRSGHPWCVNTIATVDDDALNIHDTFWIRQVTFRKSVEGTYTDLVLIPAGLLRIG